jgi:pimeloyl-ACP methyl ester carboxylesterase
MERAMLKGQKMDNGFREFFDLASRHFLYRPSMPMLGDEELRRITMPFGYWAGRKDILLPTAKIAAHLRRFVPSASMFIDKKGGHGYLPPASALREWLAETLSL